MNTVSEEAARRRSADPRAAREEIRLKHGARSSSAPLTLYALVLAVSTLLMAGCDARQSPPKPKAPTPAPAEERPEKATATEKDVTLFFGDRQAMNVIPEGRKVKPVGEPLGKVLVEELIKGPDDPFLTPNMPRGTRLRSFEVRNGVARVDFSREFRDNHPGGSAGEGMTLNSLVFTLTELPEIKAVQVLIEGREGETLAHVVFDQPLRRGPIRTHPVFLDRERQAWLQGLVDAGRDQWRRDPLGVARREGRLAAFRSSDQFRLLEVTDAAASPGTRAGAKQASVEAVHEGKAYEIVLVQPVRTGDRGVWAIAEVRAKQEGQARDGQPSPPLPGR